MLLPCAFTRNRTLVVLLSGVRRGPTRPSAIAIPIPFEPKQERICLAPKAQHSAPAWGSAPGFVEPQNNVGAESAIHFCLGLRNHLLN
jgi:hypothetical protein